MFYDEDLAYIHDQGFTGMARNAAQTVLRLLKAQKVESGLVIDLGCGAAEYSPRDSRGLDMTCSGSICPRRC